MTKQIRLIRRTQALSKRGTNIMLPDLQGPTRRRCLVAHTVTQATGANLCGYSGSVSGFLVLMLVNLNQHPPGAEDSEGMRPSTDAGEG